MIYIFVRLSKSICISVFLASFFSFEKELAIIYTSIALHECAHLAACLISKESFAQIKADIFGMRLECMPIKKLTHSLFVLISGPATSFLFFFLFRFGIFKLVHCHYIIFFAYVNLSLALANLMPVVPLDGGTIIKALLQARFGVISGAKTAKKISLIFKTQIIVIEIFCIITEMFNPSAIFFIIFLFSAQKRENELAMYDKKTILSGDSLQNKKPKYMAFDSESELLAVAEKISHSYFLIIAAFDKGKFVGDINERELLFAIRQSSPLCSLKEYFEATKRKPPS